MKPRSILLVLGALVLAVAICIGVFIQHRWDQSSLVANWLPVMPSLPDASIEFIHSRVLSRVAARQFVFTTGPGLSASDAAELFDAELASSGWEKLSFAANGNIATSSWRHKQKLAGGLQLAFTGLKLNVGGEYLGTMTTTFGKEKSGQR